MNRKAAGKHALPIGSHACNVSPLARYGKWFVTVLKEALKIAEPLIDFGTGNNAVETFEPACYVYHVAGAWKHLMCCSTVLTLTRLQFKITTTMRYT